MRSLKLYSVLGPIRVTSDPLILVEQPRIRRYRCSADNWEFWWFVVHSSDPLPCSLETVYDVSGGEPDVEKFSEIFSKLQSQSYATRCVASSSFTTMLHRWLAEAKFKKHFGINPSDKTPA